MATALSITRRSVLKGVVASMVTAPAVAATAEQSDLYVELKDFPGSLHPKAAEAFNRRFYDREAIAAFYDQRISESRECLHWVRRKRDRQWWRNSLEQDVQSKADALAAFDRLTT